ncbi:MAG: 3-phosphoshikimate 1-carboxyvinyltransferase, partial [Pirellulaceae bacterium]
MNDLYAVPTVSRPVVAEIRPPGSKSITNRALICAALARGPSRIEGALASDDTEVMIASLRRLGAAVRHDAPRATLEVEGTGGVLPVNRADLFVGNSGTTIRFLTAMLATCSGQFRLDGVERMRQRPIGDLLDALCQLGGRVRSERDNGCPPVLVDAGGLEGGTARVRGDISSQFLSGLLMACPYARHDVVLQVEGPLVSQPYVRMTLGVMSDFGVTVHTEGWQTYRLAAAQTYQGRVFAVEPDASAASYFWGAAAITAGRVKVLGLRRDALQGDVAFCDCLARMGCEVRDEPDGVTVCGGALCGIDVNMNAISDTVQTLAAVALFAEGPTTITGVGHIRHKETDRIGDLARELRKLGGRVVELSDGLRIEPGPLRGARI